MHPNTEIKGEFNKILFNLPFEMQYHLSYWEKRTFFDGIHCAVIGSGIVGLTAAIHLKTIRPEWQVVVLERGPLPLGASTRNAGFACFGSMTELLDDLRHMSMDEMLGIVEKRWAGLQRLRALVGDDALEYQELGGYELFADDEEETFLHCLECIPEFNEKIGAITGRTPVYSVADQRLSAFGFRGMRHMIWNEAEGQVNTGKMMEALLRRAEGMGVKIFNGVQLTHIKDEGADGVVLRTANGWELTIPHVLVAVNGFAKQLLPQLEVTPARNQVLITKPVPGLKVAGCFHYDRGYYYFRNIDGRILLGGGRNLAFEEEATDSFGSNELIRSALVQLLNTKICPGAAVEIDGWWSGIMGLGPVKRPIVRSISKNITVAVRLSGMGVAIGTLVGQEGAEITAANFSI